MRSCDLGEAERDDRGRLDVLLLRDSSHLVFRRGERPLRSSCNVCVGGNVEGRLMSFWHADKMFV